MAFPQGLPQGTTEIVIAALKNPPSFPKNLNAQ